MTAENDIKKAYCIETFIAKSGKRNELIAALQALALETKQELGCRQYELLQDERDDHKLILIVEFETKAQMLEHESKAYIVNFSENLMTHLCESVSWVDAIQR